MARYFFHVFDGKERRDLTGTLLRSHIEVRIHMLALAQTWMGLERKQTVLWKMEARDEHDNIVGSVCFGTSDSEEAP